MYHDECLLLYESKNQRVYCVIVIVKWTHFGSNPKRLRNDCSIVRSILLTLSLSSSVLKFFMFEHLCTLASIYLSNSLKFTQAQSNTLSHSSTLKLSQAHSSSLKFTQVYSSSLRFTQVHSSSPKFIIPSQARLSTQVHCELIGTQEAKQTF